jgi:hypothetical protein
MAKNKLNDMSIDPNKVTVKTKTEVASSDSKAPKSLKVTKEKKDPKKRISHHKGHGKQKATVCVKNGGAIQRVSRKEAAKLVDTGWAYCSRSEWRKSLQAT